jgi:hypothetical protein
MLDGTPSRDRFYFRPAFFPHLTRVRVRLPQLETKETKKCDGQELLSGTFMKTWRRGLKREG